MTYPWNDAAEHEVDRLAKVAPRFRDEPQAYKRACIRMGYEAAMSGGAALNEELRIQVKRFREDRSYVVGFTDGYACAEENAFQEMIEDDEQVSP
jgi:hypothetical protein